MVQTSTSLPGEWSNRILCYYENATSQVQIARIANIPNWLFERVVFPRQRLLFEALPDALLEVRTSTAASGSLLDQIPCLSLQVKDGIRAGLKLAEATMDTAYD
ncbi:DUF1830 domain-containing protein [Stenomitos frigidus]|uniref:DUF1830 domain-containing protein n=1 Tax=Stenomitos frigidus ULC18 TaxID=2107698 RepID=A0A2T1EEY9_9CYAN|nr:DUF1830 domain-containing protein [Stenomitos frigidus]PSB31310.1 hypothetical protein C7B82_07485 [Stenomitos frigidus ULC18]